MQPIDNSIFEAGEAIEIVVEVDDPSNIEKVVFYDSNGVIGEVTSAPFSLTTTLEDGTHFVTALARDTKGLETQATSVAVHVNTPTDIGPWTSQDIGTPAIDGWVSVDDDQVTVKGAGKLSDSSDDFHYAYQEMLGDGEVVVKLDEMTNVDHHAFAGLMIRDGLEADDKAVALGVSFTKGFEYVVTDANGKETKLYRNPFAAYLFGRSEKGADFDEIDENLDSKAGGDASGISMIEDVPMKNEDDSFKGYYLKLVREGDTFTAYGSPDKKEWIEIGTKKVAMDEKVYVGLAVDANQVSNNLHNLNTAKFSEFTFEEASIPVEKLTFNASGIKTIKKGNTLQLEVSATPTNADLSGLVFESNRTDIATIDENGLIKAVKDGTAKIIVTAVSGAVESFTLRVTK